MRSWRTGHTVPSTSLTPRRGRQSSRHPAVTDLAGREVTLLAWARVPSWGRLPSHCRTCHQTPRDSGRLGAPWSLRSSAGPGTACRPQGPWEMRQGFAASLLCPPPAQPAPGRTAGVPITPVQTAKWRRRGGPAPGLGTPTSGLLHPYWAFQLPRGLSGEGERRLHVRTRKPGLRSSKTHEGGSSWDARLWGPRCHCDRHHAGLGGCAPLSTLSTAHKDAAGRTLSCDDGNGRRGTAGRQPVSELWALTAVPRSVLRGPWSRPWSPRLARGQHWLLPTFP